MKRSLFILITGVLITWTVMVYYTKQKNKTTKDHKIYENRITVTGNAKNLGGHAVVIAPSKAVYYVEGLNEWEKNWVDQEVRITGDLVEADKRITKEEERDRMRNSDGKIIKAAVVLLLQDNGPED